MKAQNKISLQALALFALLFCGACFKSGSPASVNGPAPDSSPPTVITFETPPPSTPPPSTNAPIADANCLTNTDSRICLFDKNPVAQIGTALSDDSVNSAELSARQVFSAEINGNYTGKLENEFVRVTRFDGVGYDLGPNGAMKVPYSSARADDLSQLISYYWYSRIISTMGARLGNLPLLRRKLKIFTNDALSGWSMERSSIHLANRGNRLGEALDASALAYLMGVANADIASSGDLTSNDASSSLQACGGQTGPARQKLCCTSDAGCPRALLSGAAEYFQAIAFSNRPQLGELIANRSEGLRLCGLSRNIASNAALTRSNAYSACASSNAQGHIRTMGLLFASILWELRQQAFTDGGESRMLEFDRLYIDSLSQLRSNDTILSAKTKLLYVDQTIYGGRFNLKIIDEFARRGY